MSYGDPYYGGADEVEHVWVRPPSPPCPDCECCTAELCRTAREGGLPCAAYDGGLVVMDLTVCPCAPMVAGGGPR